MPTSSLIRWSAPLYFLGALGFAAFMIVSNGDFTGAELGLSTRHHLAHVSHFYASICFLFGVTGLYAYLREKSGAFGLVAYIVAITGDALWVGTGVITAWVWRTISASAPQLVSETGAFFNPPLPIIFVATVGLTLGLVLLCLAGWRTKLLPRGAVTISLIGLFLVNMAPPAVARMLPAMAWAAVPYSVIDVGAVLFLIGSSWIAAAVWKGAATAP